MTQPMPSALLTLATLNTSGVKAMPVPAGKLTKRVTILSPVRSENEYLEKPENWQEVASVWAAMEPLTGKEVWEASQVQPIATHKITIRYRPGMTGALRLSHKGRIFEITYVRDVQEKHEKLEIFCTEKAA